MSDDRFIDNGNETITDSTTGLTWLKKDTRQMLGKWRNLEQCQDYAQQLNNENYAGFNDWRVCKLEDIKTIFDKNYSLKAKGGDIIHLPTVFEPDCADVTWTDTVNKDRAMMFNLIKGRSNWINKLGEGPFAARIVRGKRPLPGEATG